MTGTEYEQIQQLMAIYAYAIDAKDYDAIAACFTPDAVAVYEGHSHVLRGQGEIVAHMKLALNPFDVTQHLVTNHIVDVEGGNGQLKCDVLGQHVRQGERLIAGGKYIVELRRTAGQWKISRLSARSVWSDGNKSMLPTAE